MYYVYRSRLVFVCSYLFSSEFPPPSLPLLLILQDQFVASLLYEAFFDSFKLQGPLPPPSPLYVKSVATTSRVITLFHMDFLSLSI